MTHLTIRSAALRAIVGAAAVVAALLAFVPAASAARDPISGGTTDLHMKKGFLKKLTNLGIGVAPVSTGQVGGTKIGLPVAEGMFDPTDAQGHFTSPGGFQLVRGARSVPITGVKVNTLRGALYATIGGAHMQLGTLSPLTTGREGFGARIKASQMTLTAKAARRISNQLGLKGGHRIPARVMSNEFSATVPATVTILGQGQVTLKGSVPAFKKFGEKGVELPRGVNAIAPATQPKTTTFDFPITGGIVTPDASSGSVTTGGGVEVLKKGKTLSPLMRLTNLSVELTQKTATVELEFLPDPPFPGATGRSSIVELVLPKNAVTTNPTTRQIVVKGVEAKLQAPAAATFNQVFNQGGEKAPPASSEFAGGEKLGTFSMTLQAQ